jgi:hypothetical protein
MCPLPSKGGCFIVHDVICRFTPIETGTKNKLNDRKQQVFTEILYSLL